jgi:hypothetical protein
MSKGHRPGERITHRGHKVLPASSCEIREQLKAAYESSEPDTAKRLHVFAALHAHEKKHGCGAELISK